MGQGSDMPRNPGHLPDECVAVDEDGNSTFRPVHVRLFGGYDSARAGHAPWPSAGGRPAKTRWSVSRPPHPFDIEFYEVI